MSSLVRTTTMIGLAFATLGLVLSCASSPPEAAQPASTAQPAPAADPPAAELNGAWQNAEVHIVATDDTHGLDSGMARAGFYCEWTDGQKGGVVYPKRFISSDSGQEVPMEFIWDNGGNIQAGTYDVLVDVDGRCGRGWLRNIPLEGPRGLRIVIDLNAAMLDVPLNTYRKVVVYPAGTYADYQSRNMLDEIPDELAISWYDSENRGIWAVAPSGTFDLKVEYTDGTVEWREGYELAPNSKIREL